MAVLAFSVYLFTFRSLFMTKMFVVALLIFREIRLVFSCFFNFRENLGKLHLCPLCVSLQNQTGLYRKKEFLIFTILVLSR